MFDFINVPFAWLLLRLYELVGSYGLALILFQLVTKLLLVYFQARGKKGMMQQQRLQPKIQALQKLYKDDKQKQQAAMAKLYQDEEVSPMSGCLWNLLPMPILFALYAVIREPLKNLMSLTAEQIATVGSTVNNLLTADGKPILDLANNAAYGELVLAQEVYNYFPQVQAALGDSAPGLMKIDFMFLGLNLAEIPPVPWDRLSWLILIPILSGASAYLMSYVSQKFSRMPAPQGSAKTMLYMMPLISVLFGFWMPAGLGVYWIAGNLLSIIQEYFLTKHFNKVLDAEDARKAELEERRRKAEEEQKRIDREERAARIAAKQAERKHKSYRVSKQPGGKPPK